MAKEEQSHRRFIIVDTELHNKLAVVGTDGTASITGKYNGCIRSLEKLLNKPLQWVICLLHTNELPLHHVFTMLDGTTKSPDSFSGPIGKSLTGNFQADLLLLILNQSQTHTL